MGSKSLCALNCSCEQMQDKNEIDETIVSEVDMRDEYNETIADVEDGTM